MRIGLTGGASSTDKIVQQDLLRERATTDESPATVQ
jgi:hypothetical protein